MPRWRKNIKAHVSIDARHDPTLLNSHNLSGYLGSCRVFNVENTDCMRGSQTVKPNRSFQTYPVGNPSTPRNPINSPYFETGEMNERLI